MPDPVVPPAPSPSVPLLAALGARVRARRAALGWSIADLARRSGLSARFLADLEHGAGNISVLRLSEVATALGVSLAALVGGLGPVSDEADALAGLEPARRPAALRAARAPSKIALVGLRGAGKSTVGARLAARLGCPFVEVDQAVEERAGVALGEIFEFGGAARYRELERDALVALLDRPGPAVLATGGSVVTAADTWALLRASARTVWLRASPQSHLTRVEAQGDLRPMHGRANALAELEGILSLRTPLYAQAELHVDTQGRGIDTVVEEIAGAVAAAR